MLIYAEFLSIYANAVSTPRLAMQKSRNLGVSKNEFISSKNSVNLHTRAFEYDVQPQLSPPPPCFPLGSKNDLQNDYIAYTHNKNKDEKSINGSCTFCD